MQMKIILFGVGDHYKKYRQWFYDEDIICVIDNNEQKWNTIIDGKRVLPPIMGIKQKYDKICIVSVYYEAMKEQLISLGVLENAIVHCSELCDYPEMIRKDRITQYIDRHGEVITEIKTKANSILLMSHDLDFNGATLALYYAACILKKNGYDVWFASWTDGRLNELLKEQGIGIIIEPKLQIEVFSRIEWMKKFQYIFCNTLLYYKLLKDRDCDKRYVWWLHEPEIFYQSVDKKMLKNIDMTNLKIYAVGKVASNAFKNVCTNAKIEELLYGIPDVASSESVLKKGSTFEIITVGNVQEYKGQDVLVNAIKCLPKKYKEKVHVSIIGGSNSNYYNTVRKSAMELGDVIEFVPPVTREEVYEYYKKADIYICSSRQDCMPVVVAESMMYSLPSIVSDVAGIAPFVRQCKGGLLFQNGNSADLAEKIVWCMENEYKLKEFGDCARKKYEEDFSLDSFEKRFMKIIRSEMG